MHQQLTRSDRSSHMLTGVAQGEAGSFQREKNRRRQQNRGLELGERTQTM
jgi:hypothetical protein